MSFELKYVWRWHTGMRSACDVDSSQRKTIRSVDLVVGHRPIGSSSQQHFVGVRRLREAAADLTSR